MGWQEGVNSDMSCNHQFRWLIRAWGGTHLMSQTWAGMNYKVVFFHYFEPDMGWYLFNLQIIKRLFC
jgi:hypothetical protein